MRNKLFIFIITLLLSFFGGVGGSLYAQDPELFNHTWYLHKIVLDDGTEHIPVPNNDVPFIALIFFDDTPYYYFETSECNYFAGEVTYQSSNNFLIIHSESSLLTCEPTANFYFEGMQFGFFLEGGDHIEAPFQYNITTNGNEKTLTTTNVRGDEAIYGDQLLSTGQYEDVQFTLYPNPVQETLHISQSNYQFVSATIYDVRGKKLKSYFIENSSSTIDVKALNPGLYFLVLESESGERVTQKFVKK